jgi:hypothetical protein
MTGTSSARSTSSRTNTRDPIELVLPPDRNQYVCTCMEPDPGGLNIAGGLQPLDAPVVGRRDEVSSTPMRIEIAVD